MHEYLERGECIGEGTAWPGAQRSGQSISSCHLRNATEAHTGARSEGGGAGGEAGLREALGFSMRCWSFEGIDAHEWESWIGGFGQGGN